MTKTKYPLHPTLNNLHSNTKTVVIQLLNARLADGLDIALITKQAHWNMKGHNFIGVHKMMDDFRSEQNELNDKMAERIAAIGGTALGTTQEIAKNSSIAEYPTDIISVDDHLTALSERFAIYANALRKAIDEADEAGDADTSDLFTEVSRAMDQQLWFLEAHKPYPSKLHAK